MARRATGALAALIAVVAVAAAAAPARPATPRGPAHCTRHAPSGLRAPSWRRARHVLAPRGATAVRLCRYSGLNAPRPLRLVRSVERTRPRLLRRLVRQLDALPAASGAYSCPTDDGAEIVAHFAYPGGRRLTIGVALAGCQIATNGKVVRMAARGDGPRLLRRLRRLTS